MHDLRLYTKILQEIISDRKNVCRKNQNNYSDTRIVSSATVLRRMRQTLLGANSSELSNMGSQKEKTRKASSYAGFRVFLGGEGGIRTHGCLATSPDFESGTFNHSATSPSGTRF
jgi:hypothetical protein